MPAADGATGLAGMGGLLDISARILLNSLLYVVDAKTFPVTAPADAAALAAHAMQAIQARQWDLAMNPQSYEACQVRALAPFYAGRPVDAMPHAEALVSRFPTDPFAHSTFGLVLNALGRTEQAIKAFRRTVAL